MKVHAFLLLPLLLLTGCGPSYFLNKEELARLHSTPSAATSTIFYGKTFTAGAADQLAIKTHTVIRVGDNLRNMPELLTVYDGSMERLTAYQARVLHKDGSADTYGKGELISLALSNRYRIAESTLKLLQIQDKVFPGDYIETVAVHETSLGGLGMAFSVSEVGSRAENIECAFILPGNDTLHYAPVNCAVTPSIEQAEGQRVYRFSWPSYSASTVSQFAFSKHNRSPGVLASQEACSQWREFGDWYLKLIASCLEGDEALAAKAREITRDAPTPLEKLEAIAAYCQEEVRYEQVYLTHGEVIPNDTKTIFARKYGDCKDYSVLIYAMAHAVGVKPHLALCTRGRGFEFRPEIAVSQFNHMLLHYSDGMRDYWYDGTNRAGKPGITADDLINATALVLEPSNSQLVKIDEAPENLLSLGGSFFRSADGLAGTLTVTLAGQYAIAFIAAARLESSTKMKEAVTIWFRENLNSALTIHDVQWRARASEFTIVARCTIPNALIVISPAAYLRFSALFPNLMPEADPAERPDELFYFPGYTRVKAAIELPEFRDSLSASTDAPACRRSLEYRLPSGPFGSAEAQDFLTAYARAVREFTTSHKIYGKDPK